MLDNNHSTKKQLALEGQGCKEFETEQLSGFTDSFQDVFCAEEYQLCNAPASKAIDNRIKVQLDDERCQQERIDYEPLKKMRRSRRQYRFLAYIGVASNPLNFPSIKELYCKTSRLKHSSYVQYVIVYQKSCTLI